MRYGLSKNLVRVRVIALLALPLVAGSAPAAEFWLRADNTTVGMPSGASPPQAGDVAVTMWGFAPATAAGPGSAPVTVPGPRLDVPAGDATLTIHVYNNLAEPVSVVIPGQVTTMTPVKFTDARGRERVRSFTHEAAPGGSASYTWNNLQAGTYLYQSGTHPAVQVQMGLYGAMTHNAVDAAAGVQAQGYAGVTYDSDVTLLYSEIDPALHAAVAGGTYGTAVYPSTVNYAPKYFLINGSPFNGTNPPVPAGATGQTTLLRFLNAGLRTLVPVLHGLDMQLVAEDGKPYLYRKEQYSVFLPAGKTTDALIAPTGAADAVYPLQDRRLSLSNGAAPDGGMLTYLAVTTGTGLPAANPDAFAVSEDNVLTAAAPGVLVNDTGTTAVLENGAQNGSVTLNADGSFSYAPGLNFNGNDAFTYRATNGALASDVATVSIAVNAVNDAPVAANNAYSVAAGTTLSVAAAGVLTNDTDADGDTLTATVATAPASGTLVLNGNGSFSYTPNAGFTGTDTFRYTAGDAAASSNIATVTITVVASAPNTRPVAVNDTVATVRNTPVVINVLANDSDPDGTLNPATVTIVTAPNKGGTAVVNANGTIRFTPKPNFRGTDTFRYNVRDNRGAVSNNATVRVNVTR